MKNPGMYGNLYKILKKTLGDLHPLVQKMKAKLDEFLNKKPDDKVLDFPDKTLDDTSDLRINQDLDVEGATSEQIKDFESQLEKIIDIGPEKFKGLPIDTQGNIFRNVKRYERKLLQTQKPDEGIASLKRPESPVLEITSGKPFEGEGLASLQKKFGLPEGSPGPRKSKIDQGIISLKRNVAEADQSVQELLSDADQMSSARAKQSEDLFPDATMKSLSDKTELRGVARQIIIDDIKAGRLKNLSPGMKKGMLEPTGSGLDGDPIDVLFRYYGGEAFEVLDELTKKHGATIDGIDLIKLDLKNKVGIRDDFEFKPLDFPMPTLGGKEGKIPLTQKEVVEFLTGVDADGNPISKEKLKFYNKHFDVGDDDADVQNYLKRFLTDETQVEFLKNLPSNFDAKGAKEIQGTILPVEDMEKLKFKVDPEDAQMDIDPDDLVEAPGLPNILAV